jgi:hypothetical protein
MNALVINRFDDPGASATSSQLIAHATPTIVVY